MPLRSAQWGCGPRRRSRRLPTAWVHYINRGPLRASPLRRSRRRSVRRLAAGIGIRSADRVPWRMTMWRLTAGALSAPQREAMGFIQVRPGNRAKSRSVVHSVAPCSIAMAASAASMTSGPDTWPSRARGRRISQCLSPGSRIPATGCASHDDTWCSASAIVSGRSKTRGFVMMRRKAHTVSQENRTSDCAGETRFQPMPTGLVFTGGRVVGVEEEIRVDEHHRCSGPSTCSTRSAMLSRLSPGRRRPSSRASTTNRSRDCARGAFARPRRSASLTTSRKARPVRRATDFNLAATSSSSVRVVRTS